MRPRIRAVVRKEFREYRRNKLILLTMGLLPTFFLAIPLATLILLPDDASAEAVEGIVGQGFLFFLLIPLILPSTIAAYTVIGEREQGTLEPVLASPLTDEELLRGKATAATVPSVLLAWLFYAVFVTVAALFGAAAAHDEVLSGSWLVAQLALSPPLALFSIELGMIISARSTDIRVAQQLSGLAMLPMVAIIILFSVGVLDATVPRFLMAAGVVAVVDVALWQLVERTFDRDRLLARFGT